MDTQVYTLSPSVEQAAELAMMITAGMPSVEAIRYFCSDPDAGLVRHVHDAWMKHENVAQAILKLQGKSWHKMSKDERLQWAKDKAYAEMAYYLYSHNYSELTGNELLKYDSCRKAIETKLAGLEGQNDGQRFWNELLSGKLKASPTATPKTSDLVYSPVLVR